MAVASLTNLTVPLASGQSASTQGLLMPKLKYRFRLSFLNFGVSAAQSVELTKQVADVKRPSVSFGDIVIDVYNSKVKLAGKHEWQDITINLRDDVGGNVSKLVGEQLQKQLDFQEQASAASGIDYKFQLTIDILDGGNGALTPNILEQWQLYGCYLSQVDYGDVNYSSGTDPVMIALTVKYDNAEQTPQGNQTAGVGFGATVSQTIGAITG
jgi:hypothetical protein